MVLETWKFACEDEMYGGEVRLESTGMPPASHGAYTVRIVTIRVRVRECNARKVAASFFFGGAGRITEIVMQNTDPRSKDNFEYSDTATVFGADGI